MPSEVGVFVYICFLLHLSIYVSYSGHIEIKALRLANI